MQVKRVAEQPVQLQQRPGRPWIECEIEELMLAPGSYRIDVTIHGVLPRAPN